MGDAVVVIVMPTYNEAAGIREMIHVLRDIIFPQIHGAQMQLLVVDDNSPDGTGEIVREMTVSTAGLHLLTGQKKGLGWAYVRGMREAMNVLHADAVIEMDSDFQHDPAYVPVLVTQFLDGADYVIGSRYISGGSVPSSWPMHRKWLSSLGNLAARFVLKAPHLHDLTTGFRLTRVKGVLDQIMLEKLLSLDHFAYKIDLMYQSVHLARQTVEIPIHFQERTSGTTKFSFRELTASCCILLQLRFKTNR